MTDYRESVRVADWLASRVPAPPPAVSGTLRSILGDESCELRDLPSRLVSHALTILSEVHDERSYAPRLLAADALISYAMEAAAGDCGAFDAFATGAAQALAALQK